MKDKTQEVAELDQGRVDSLIWKNIGRVSVREIASLTGIKPEEVLRRKNELLDEIDVLSIHEKQTKILIELDAMAYEMRERARGSIDEYASGMVNSAITAHKTVLQQLDRLQKQDSGKIEALNNMRVKELLRLVDFTVARSVREIAAAHDLDETELMEVFQGHLVEAARELESE